MIKKQNRLKVKIKLISNKLNYQIKFNFIPHFHVFIFCISLVNINYLIISNNFNQYKK